MKKYILSYLISIFTLGIISPVALAGSSTNTTKSTATLASSCQFVASDVVFGT